MDRKTEIVVAAGIIFLAGGLYYVREGSSRHTVSPSNSDNEQIVSLLADAEKTLSIGQRSQTSSCHVRGPFPDPACTPGAIFPDATLAEICVPGYTARVRNVSAKTKNLVYEEYGFSYPQPPGAFEADHLIPLELGGSNDIANLFPEAALPVPGFHEKDLVENYLHGEACAGRVPLDAAQKQIANDWLAVYQALTPDELAALRAQAQRFGD